MCVQVPRGYQAAIPHVLRGRCSESLLCTGDPRVTSRTDKFFAKALAVLADVDNKTRSAYLHRTATALYLRFPPVHSPDRMDDTQKVLVRNHERPEESVTGKVDDVAASHPILSEAEDESDDGAQE